MRGPQCGCSQKSPEMPMCKWLATIRTMAVLPERPQIAWEAIDSASQAIFAYYSVLCKRVQKIHKTTVDKRSSVVNTGTGNLSEQ